MGATKVIRKLILRHSVQVLLFITVILLFKSWMMLNNLNQKLLKSKNLTLKPEQIGKKDWHDYKQQQKDVIREGPGEQGLQYDLKRQRSKEEIQLERYHGFNAFISDHISVERAVPDMRNEICQRKVYLSNLPAVSVIFIFVNEYPSVLMRSIHSVVNRTPKNLLHEIILVDDFSDDNYLKTSLEDYLWKHFPRNLIRIVRLKKNSGIVAARIEGARVATAPVLVFFDSHIETNYNWLPPLLEPIAFDVKTVTVPLIDVINSENFEYQTQDEGSRGFFDWKMDYKRIAFIPNKTQTPTDPFPTPVMAGGLFAISRDYFWYLGGYDPALALWGAEQYELSFKVWMCGGRMLEIPCSRVAHIYRNERPDYPKRGGTNDLYTNIKRVAEVWMDEYKDYIYKFDESGTFYKIDVGNLTAQKELRTKLNCKSFQWFLTNVAPELTYYFPLVWPTPYATGIIQSLVDSNLCLDTLKGNPSDEIGVKTCSPNLDKPNESQNWELSYFRDLRPYHTQMCVDGHGLSSSLTLLDCHQPDLSLWYYDRMNFWLRIKNNGTYCLEALPKQLSVRISQCDNANRQLRWHFGNVNHSALNQYNFD